MQPRAAASRSSRSVIAVPSPRRARGLERRDVEDPAVALVIDRDRGRDVLAAGAPGDHVERGRVRPAEQALGHAGGLEVVEMVGPARRGDVGLGAVRRDLRERHPHRAGGRVDGVAPATELGVHPLVGLVDPGGEALDAGRAVRRLHRVDRRRAGAAIEQGVVEDAALGLGREHGRGDAVQTTERGAVRAAAYASHDARSVAFPRAKVESAITATPVRRRGRDSNPRYPCGHNGFRDRPIQPLSHPSEALWRSGGG